MAVRRRRKLVVSPDEVLFATAKRKSVPFDWVLAELDALGPTTNPMFGCTAVYVDEKIVFILRDRPSHADRTRAGDSFASSPTTFAKIEVEYFMQKPDGSMTPAGKMGYDVKQQS